MFSDLIGVSYDLLLFLLLSRLNKDDNKSQRFYGSQRSGKIDSETLPYPFDSPCASERISWGVGVACPVVCSEGLVAAHALWPLSLAR